MDGASIAFGAVLEVLWRALSGRWLTEGMAVRVGPGPQGRASDAILEPVAAEDGVFPDLDLRGDARYSCRGTTKGECSDQ